MVSLTTFSPYETANFFSPDGDGPSRDVALLPCGHHFRAGLLGIFPQMPGSATDYSFLGNPAQFPTINNYGAPGAPDMGVHPDFTLTADVGEAYGGDDRYSVIKTPTGTSTQTGILFGRAGGTNQSILDLKLGTGSTTFNYADFNLYVMFGNDIGDGAHDAFISVQDVTAGTTVVEQAVADSNSDLSKAAFAEFNITGASAGDVIRIGATEASGGLNYLGGVSLSSVAAPEPSVDAMLAGGLVLLGALAFRGRRLRSV